MNWGHKIIAVYIVFVGGMILLAYKSSQQNIELVTDDYYAKELVYQEKVDELKRTASLSTAPVVKMVEGGMSIIFPPDFNGKQLTGEATLYCPSDEKRDRVKKFTVTDTGVNFSFPDEFKGLHYVKIQWSSEGLNYYYEQKIII